MNFNRVVCFDLEMCCWNVDGKGTTGEIIEIGLAEIDLAKQEIVKRAQYYVKPEQDEVSFFLHRADWNYATQDRKTGSTSRFCH